MPARTRAVMASSFLLGSQSFGRTKSSATMFMSRYPKEPIRPQLDLKVPIEEELLSSYQAQDYYPVRIGTVLDKKYKVLAKLGFGRYSTVWLGQDTHRRIWQTPHYIALKIQTVTMSKRSEDNMELQTLELSKAHADQSSGASFVRFAQASIGVEGPYGRHTCFLYEPMHQTLRALLRETTLPLQAVKVLLQRLLEGLDYLHTKCHVIHTDIHNDNILLEIKNPEILKAIEEHERIDPSPVKVYSTHQVHSSLSVSADPGPPQLADCGNSIFGPGPFTHPIQRDRLRAPEVILGTGWTYSADIWNVGVLLWDILEDRVLFKAEDPETGEYSETAHLQEMAMLLGPPPPKLLSNRQWNAHYSTAKGDEKHLEPNQTPCSGLGESVTQLGGIEKHRFLVFVRRMLTWLPEERATARELLSDPFLKDEQQE